MKRNLSQAYDFQSVSLLTKFNLTKYKAKSTPKNTSSHFFNFKNTISKQSMFFYPKTQCNKHSKTIKHFNENSNLKTLDFIKLKKTKKSPQKPQIKLQITSQTQRKLIEFLNPQTLPTIQIKNKLKQSSIQKIMKVLKNQKKLKKYTENYFYSLQKANRQLKKKKATEYFPEIKVLGWSVKGYKLQDKIILKAVRFQKQQNDFERRKIEKYKKVSNTSQNLQRIEADYLNYVKQWLYLQNLISNETINK